MHYLLQLLLPLTLLLLCLKSYRDYLRIGPGGFGGTPAGWVRAIFVKFLLLAHRVNNIDTSIYDDEIREGGNKAKGWLSVADVPVRLGERPCLVGFPVPQRHIVHEENPELAAEQLDFLWSLASEHPSRIVFGCSVIERIGPALFAHPSVPKYPHLSETRREILHIHLAPFSYPCCHPPAPSNVVLSPGEIAPYSPHSPPPGAQSLHMTLSSKDAKLVIEQGWGVRFPASGTPPWPLASMPSGFIFVYAPRNQMELEILKRLCRASIAFSVGAGANEEKK